MSELLTAKDIELKIFKKVSFGGYAVSDVEEFLNQVAEDLEVYAFRLNEQQRRLLELEKVLKENEAMKDTIKDALILAQKSAKDKEEEANLHAEHILAKAESKLSEVGQEVRRRLEEAESSADDIIAAARVTAAQIIKKAEDTWEDTQRKIENTETDAERLIADANKRADEITSMARFEAKRMTENIRKDIEDAERELSSLQTEKTRFLTELADLVNMFGRSIDMARQKQPKSTSQELDDLPALSSRGKKNLPFSPAS